MAAGFMPAETDTPDLTNRACAICNKPIVEGERFFQRDTWKILGHMLCVLEHPETWDALPDH